MTQVSAARTWRDRVGACGGWVAVALALLVACGGSAPTAPPIEVPHRPATVGDSLLAVLPAGADVIVEVDLVRLRENSVVGPLLAALAQLPKATLAQWALRGGDALEIALAIAVEADAAVLASYQVGSRQAATLIALRGGGELLAAEDLGDGVMVSGPKAWVERARVVSRGSSGGLAEDRALMAIRAAAMPENATGAWLRVAGRFDFDARVSLASRLELNQVPSRVSVWADVADDLAVIALAGGERSGESKRFASTLRRTLRRLSSSPLVRDLGLGGTLDRARVDADGELARAIVVVSPERLRRVATLLMKQLSAAAPAVPRAAE